MGLNLEDKKAVVAEVSAELANAQAVVVAEYRGLEVGQITALRAKARESGVYLRVLKNTLVRRAVVGTPFEGLSDSMVGPLIYGIAADPVSPAKVLNDFAKTNEKLEIKIGVIDGKLIDLTAIKALASLPSREQLLATVLSAMIAVPTSFVRALNDVPRRMVNVLQAIKDQKESQAA